MAHINISIELRVARELLKTLDEFGAGVEKLNSLTPTKSDGGEMVNPFAKLTEELRSATSRVVH